ncbi:hypothetical protein M15_19150 [Atrimonas thermophila]
MQSLSMEERKKILEMYKDLRVADVRDGLDWCGYHHYGSVHHDIKPLWRPCKAVGFARTARYLPYEGPSPKETGEEYTKWVDWYYRNVCSDDWGEDVIEGDFICLDVCGIDVGLLGSNNTLAYRNKGAVGFLTNGGVRDSDEIIRQGIPIWCRFVSQSMDQARIRYYEKNVPIAIGGVAIYPGDLVVADGDGVVVVPAKIVYEVYKYAYQEMKKDKVARRKLYVEGGLPLDETVDTEGLE